MPYEPIERDDAPDPEIIDFYLAERPGEDRNIIAAFVYAGVEPPMHRDGFTYTQEKLIRRYYDRFDPNGSQRESAEFNA